jgi:hypothetical protein
VIRHCGSENSRQLFKTQQNGLLRCWLIASRAPSGLPDYRKPIDGDGTLAGLKTDSGSFSVQNRNRPRNIWLTAPLKRQKEDKFSLAFDSYVFSALVERLQETEFI